MLKSQFDFDNVADLLKDSFAKGRTKAGFEIRPSLDIRIYNYFWLPLSMRNARELTERDIRNNLLLQGSVQG